MYLLQFAVQDTVNEFYLQQHSVGSTLKQVVDAVGLYSITKMEIVNLSLFRNWSGSK